MSQAETRTDPVEDELRHVMQLAADRYCSSPAPTQQILQAGRKGRARRRSAMAVVCAAMVTCLGIPVAVHSGSSSRPGTHGETGSPASSPSGAVSQVIGSGVVDGKRWSVTMTFYPRLPAAYLAAADRKERETISGSLLCQRTVVSAVRVDHKGGTWSGCRTVTGTSDPHDEAGLWGNRDKGTSGVRVYVGHPTPNATRAVITLKDGRRLAAEVRTVPGTKYRAFAAGIGDGQMVASVDEYDADDHLVRHQLWG